MKKSKFEIMKPGDGGLGAVVASTVMFCILAPIATGIAGWFGLNYHKRTAAEIAKSKVLAAKK